MSNETKYKRIYWLSLTIMIVTSVVLSIAIINEYDITYFAIAQISVIVIHSFIDILCQFKQIKIF